MQHRLLIGLICGSKISPQWK